LECKKYRYEKTVLKFVSWIRCNIIFDILNLDHFRTLDFENCNNWID